MIDNLEDDVDISEELADTSDLPTSVIITNMDSDVFMDEYKKVLWGSLSLECINIMYIISEGKNKSLGCKFIPIQHNYKLEPKLVHLESLVYFSINK